MNMRKLIVLFVWYDLCDDINIVKSWSSKFSTVYNDLKIENRDLLDYNDEHEQYNNKKVYKLYNFLYIDRIYSQYWI